MRRILILLAVLILFAVALFCLWIFRGREVSLFVDRYWTIQTESAPIHSIAYEGNGTGGVLIVNDLSLSLNEISPNISLSIGSTKDNQFALSSSGKVFAFGPLATTSGDSNDHLAAVPAAADQGSVIIRHSIVSWPSPFDLNFMTGNSPSWKRHMYYELRWKKASGSRLEMLWCYEQFFHPAKGWTSGLMTHRGSTGLVGLEIGK